MDSKSPFPDQSMYDETSPPAYTESVPRSEPITFPSDPSDHTPTSQYYSHQIQSQLHSLTTRIKSTTTQKSLLAHAKDEQILALLTAQIQSYLSAFAASGLCRGTLILIPARALQDENAVPVDYDFRDPEEYDRMVKVADKQGGEDSRDEGEMWYWRDEEMARRVAGYLRPAREMRGEELPPRKPAVAPVSPASPISAGGFRRLWGRKKSVAKAVERPVLVEEQGSWKAANDARVVEEDKVIMDVKAEEVVFRTENDFGIYETQRGWGIVLKLKVILKQRLVTMLNISDKTLNMP